MYNHRKSSSAAVRQGTEQAERPVRIASGRPIAKRWASRTLTAWENAEKEMFDLMRTIAERRGETPPSRQATIRNEKSEDRTPADLVEARGNAENELTEEEVNELARIFAASLAAVIAIAETEQAAAYTDGLRYAYERMKQTARPQDPARFARIAEDYPFNPQSSLFQQFRQNGLSAITAKISVHFQSEAFDVIGTGLQQGESWSRIAANLRKRVGMGAKWHWVRLVRSEIQAAYHFAARERGQAAGIEYEFLSVSRTACPICISARGYYRLGQGPALPIHPNCRCTWIHYFRLPRGATLRE